MAVFVSLSRVNYFGTDNIVLLIMWVFSVLAQHGWLTGSRMRHSALCWRCGPPICCRLVLGGAKVVVCRFFLSIFTFKSTQTLRKMADCVAPETKK